ncbi:MAG: sulfatase-like hydrolase/transferase [Planctomycetota bacterium]
MRRSRSPLSGLLWLVCLVAAGSAPAHAQETVRNVLFIIADDLRADALGSYGNAICKTPNIDALARRSVVFDRAYDPLQDYTDVAEIINEVDPLAGVNGVPADFSWDIPGVTATAA